MDYNPVLITCFFFYVCGEPDAGELLFLPGGALRRVPVQINTGKADSPFNHYIYSNELAATAARRIGKTFGPGLSPAVHENRMIVKQVYDPVLQRAGMTEGSELLAIDGQHLTVEKAMHVLRENRK